MRCEGLHCPGMTTEGCYSSDLALSLSHVKQAIDCCFHQRFACGDDEHVSCGEYGIGNTDIGIGGELEIAPIYVAIRTVFERGGNRGELLAEKERPETNQHRGFPVEHIAHGARRVGRFHRKSEPRSRRCIHEDH